ncbi:MAG: AtpZ/AtpI family protein [Patescibacteria group bacterium]|nr:AtpZ/AtpI family protein [Patescibacteria group bacterium]
MQIETNQPKKDTPKAVDKNSMSLGQAFSLAWELGYLMAIPLILFALGGRLLDKYLNTSPAFLMLGIVSSIIVSSILVALKATKIISGITKGVDNRVSKDNKTDHENDIK